MIHPSAVVETGAQIDPTAEIGPYCYISGQAKIAAGNKLIARVTVLGDTTLGEGNVIFPGACLGGGQGGRSQNITDCCRERWAAGSGTGNRE